MKPSPDQIGLSPIPRSIFGRPEMVAGDQRVITMTISGRPENGLLRRALVLDVQNFSNCATLQRGQASQVNPDVWIYSAATRRHPLRAPRPKTMWFSDVRKPLRRALILERPELGYSATLAEFLNWTTAKVEAVLNALAIQPREPGVPQEEHPKVLFYF